MKNAVHSKKLAIIGNPNAGQQNLARIFRQSSRTLWGWPCEYQVSTSASHLVEICASLTPEEYEAAVVIGGDGTQNHAIKGLILNKNRHPAHLQVPLLAFPAGTANDLASELGISNDWNLAQKLINHENHSSMDLITVNDLPFATVAGVGLGATMTDEFNRRRNESKTFRFLYRTFGKKVYTPLAVRTIAKNWGSERLLHIQSGFFNEKIKTSAVFVCNQSTLGTDMTVAPDKTNTDQRLKVLIIPRPSGIPMLRALKAMKEGQFPEDFISFYTNELRITDVLGEALSVFADGEVLTRSQVLDFKVLPQHLRIYRKPEFLRGRP